MANRPVHRLRVQDKRPLTANMTRLTLTGPSLAEFPDACEGGYVKLLVPREPGVDVSALDVESLDPRACIKRSYTVRAIDRDAGLLTLDFVASGHPGIASTWLGRCAVGDVGLVAGPGPVASLDPKADWMLLAADMTALPALAVQLERLPRDARGIAVIEVLHEDDRQSLDAPSGVDIRWVVSPDVRASRLAESVRACPWDDRPVSFWAACEFSSMKQLRSYLFQERGIARDAGYLSSYWKLDATDEQHKLAKRADAQGPS